MPLIRSCPYVVAIAAGISALSASPAHAATFALTDTGGVAGTPAETGFQIATAYWSAILTSNVMVKLNIGYAALGATSIGNTASAQYSVLTSDVYARLGATSTSALDATAVANLSPLTGAGGLQAITTGYVGGDAAQGVDFATRIWDANDTLNNQRVAVTASLAKALGYSVNPISDASVTFSNQFAFDFDPTDGIEAGKMDFLAVAIHEIGHALGFFSGVDVYDTATGTTNLDTRPDFTVLDLFRYSSDPYGIAPGSQPMLDLSVGSNAYFSIDGGQTAFGNAYFASGAVHGDGTQASHFKDSAGCGGQIGLLDPTICYGQMGTVTANDLAAYDAMGWTLSLNVMQNPNYAMTTSQIYTAYSTTAVPEPASWGMMIAGFGLIGVGMRRRVRVAIKAA